jgi:hypothetical protein
MAAIARPGTNEIVAAFETGARPVDAMITTRVYANGAWNDDARAWSASSVGFAGRTVASMAALPAGRVAIAVVGFTGQMSVGIYDGSQWRDASPQGVVASTEAGAAASIARGIDGTAVLELVYIDHDTRALKHTRLVDEGAGRWSDPTTVEATQMWASVFIAAAP